MIADYLAREVVDPVFAVPQAYSAPDAILARLRLRRPDLLRLLRLHGHGDRPRAADGLRLPAELQPPVPRHQLPRLLAPLAHDAVALPARLPLHPARRQPQGPRAHLRQPDARRCCSAGSGTAPPGPSSSGAPTRAPGCRPSTRSTAGSAGSSPAGCAGSSPST